MARRPPRVESRRFLPPDPRVEEPYRLTPKLAVRIGILGTIAIAVFAVLFLRLWSLQILNGEQLLRAAQDNQRRDVRIQAPRGPILDRNGLPLVVNVPGTAVQIWQSDLPKRRGVRLHEIRALARILDLPALQIGGSLRRHRSDPLTPVKVKDGVSDAQALYLTERAEDFPGVKVVSSYLRYYPHNELAAHVLGYTGEISEAQLKVLRKSGYQAGDTIGQSGIESAYDRYLRGTTGLAEFRVDSLGRPRSPFKTTILPRAGNAVRLTLDLKLQVAAEAALRYGLARARASNCYGCWDANGGAVVALDPRDGSIRALASYPTYRPSLFSGRVRQRALDAAGLTSLTARGMNYPALDRATDATYPPGSTFKPVVALAALEAGVITPESAVSCPGYFELGNATFHCWRQHGHGTLRLRDAIKQSCDVFFYEFARRLGIDRLAAMARRFGFGGQLGLDIPGERPGLMPTRDWKLATTGTTWQMGESLIAGIGQGSVLATPLQLATMVARLVTGRAIVPHVVRRAGKLQQGGDKRLPDFAGLGLNPRHLALVLDGMNAVVNEQGGTAFAARIKEAGLEMGGKSGTSQVRRISQYERDHGIRKATEVPWKERDHALFVSYAPVASPRYVCAAVVEHGGEAGGGGSAVAAPICRDVLIEAQRRDPARRVPQPDALARIAPELPLAAPVLPVTAVAARRRD